MQPTLINRDHQQRGAGRAETKSPDGGDTKLVPRPRLETCASCCRAGLLCAGLMAVATFSFRTATADAGAPRESSTAQTVNPVVQWNRTLLAIIRTHGAQPATVHSTRSFTLMHAAIYDAVNSIDRTHQPYLVDLPRASQSASQDAAAAAAAHEVLSQLYPAFQATLDAQLQQELAQIPDGAAKTDGISIGQGVADLILDLRRNDGSSAQPAPYVFGNAPGDYQSTPPNFPSQPQFTHWAGVMPFALEQANQFRPGPPPALDSDAYADAFNEVKTFGITNIAASSADQALAGRFWNGAIQNYWNEIAQTAVLAHSLTTASSARLFALLNLSVADSVIAFYEAKYTYNFWRPVTAIREASTQINPDTSPDPNWLPEVGNTTPDPAYPGAHAVISAAASHVLISVLRSDNFDYSVTSEVLPGTTRSFQTFSAAAEEATLSRIFAGVHFRFDLATGHRLGREVSDFVLAHLLLPRHREHNANRHE